MHNVLLGTVKLMMTVWKAKGLISSPQYEEIQKIVDVFIILEEFHIKLVEALAHLQLTNGNIGV